MLAGLLFSLPLFASGYTIYSTAIEPEHPLSGHPVRASITYPGCYILVGNPDGEFYDVSLEGDQILVDFTLIMGTCILLPPATSVFELGSFLPGEYEVLFNVVPPGPFPADPDSRHLVAETEFTVSPGGMQAESIPGLGRVGVSLLVVFFVLAATVRHQSRNRFFSSHL